MVINKNQLKTDISHIIDVSTNFEDMKANIENHLKVMDKVQKHLKNTKEVKPVNITGYTKTNLKIIKD